MFAHMVLASCYSNMDKFEESLFHSRKASDATPEPLRVQHVTCAAQALIGLKRYKEALEELNKVPSNADSMFVFTKAKLQSQACAALGNFKDALTASTLAIKLVKSVGTIGEQYSLRLEHTNLLVALNRIPEVIPICDDMIKLAPQRPHAYCQRADCNVRLRNYAASIKDCQLLIAMKQQIPNVYLTLGIALCGAGQLQEAIKTFSIAEQLQTDKRGIESCKIYAKQAKQALEQGKSCMEWSHGTNYSVGISVPENRICSYCTAIRDDLKRCSRCQGVRYCNAECQTKHWPIHKKDCVVKPPPTLKFDI